MRTQERELRVTSEEALDATIKQLEYTMSHSSMPIAEEKLVSPAPPRSALPRSSTLARRRRRCARRGATRIDVRCGDGGALWWASLS